MIDPSAVSEVVSGRTKAQSFGAPPDPHQAILPGSFNPLHAGHQKMAEIAQSELSVAVAFEISIVNVDKPTLSLAQCLSRLQQFSPRTCVWLTRAPTFVEKARLFPGSTFVIGADTANRLFDQKYFSSKAKREDLVGELTELGASFLVFGRLIGGCFQSVDWDRIPPSVHSLFRCISEQEFREDISSTQLRASRTKPRPSVEDAD